MFLHLGGFREGWSGYNKHTYFFLPNDPKYWADISSQTV